MAGLAEGYTPEYMASLKACPQKYEASAADITGYKYLLRKGLPQKLMQKLDDAIAYLQSAGYFSQRLTIGDKVPDFSVNSYQEQQVTLSDLLKKSPVVLSFFRGRWCGYDTSELQYLQKIHHKINAQMHKVHNWFQFYLHYRAICNLPNKNTISALTYYTTKVTALLTYSALPIQRQKSY
jgi:hypothetical protein